MVRVAFASASSRIASASRSRFFCAAFSARIHPARQRQHCWVSFDRGSSEFAPALAPLLFLRPRWLLPRGAHCVLCARNVLHFALFGRLGPLHRRTAAPAQLCGVGRRAAQHSPAPALGACIERLALVRLAPALAAAARALRLLPVKLHAATTPCRFGHLLGCHDLACFNRLGALHRTASRPLGGREQLHRQGLALRPYLAVCLSHSRSVCPAVLAAPHRCPSAPCPVGAFDRCVTPRLDADPVARRYAPRLDCPGAPCASAPDPLRSLVAVCRAPVWRRRPRPFHCTAALHPATTHTGVVVIRCTYLAGIFSSPVCREAERPRCGGSRASAPDLIVLPKASCATAHVRGRGAFAPAVRVRRATLV